MANNRNNLELNEYFSGPQEETAPLHYLNILRVLASFAVVVTHVSASVLFTATPLTSLAWWVANLGESVSRWCIPVFIMISGALLLDPSREYPMVCFYKKRVKRIFFPLVFWTFFYFAIRSGSGWLTITEMIQDILRGEPYYHLWYLYMIPGLYLFTPFLRTYVKYSSNKERIVLIIMTFILANCYLLINQKYFGNQHSVFTVFPPYLAYYLCGYQLRLMGPRKIKLHYLVATVMVFVLFIAMGTGISVKIFGMQKGLFLYNFLCPPVIVMSVAVFLTMYRLAYSQILSRSAMIQFVERFAQTSFGIYLLHAAIIHVMTKVIEQSDINHYSLFSVPTLAILVFLLSYVVVSIVIRIPFLRRVVA